MYYAFHLCSSQSTAIRFREIKKNTVPSDNDTTKCYRTKYARRAAEFHIPRAPKEKKTGGRGDRRKASAKSRAIVFSYRSEITRLYDNSHKITPLYSCTLTLGRLICQQKHQCIRFNFCMKLKIRFLSPSRKAETARGSFPCCCKRNKSLSSQISRLRLLTGKLETPDLGKKENAGSLAKFSTFYPYEGIGAGKARGVYHFYGNWLFSLPFFGKTAKRFALSLGRKYSILFREVFIYRGSMPCMTNVRRKSLWHLLRSPKRTTSRLSP